MNEREMESFRLVAAFYDRFRSEILETDEQWAAFAEGVKKLAAELDIDNNPLGWHLMEAALETFNDLYWNGMKPVPAGYFGRDDI